MGTQFPYGLLSDIHCHAWSAFSSRLPSGVNNRLQITLDEIDRAAEEVRKAGGNTLVIAGDLLHTRGSMDPEVFNPLHRTIECIADDMKILIIPGNHDLKGADSDELGNAIQTLDAIDNVEVVTQKTGRLFKVLSDLKVDQHLLMLPWHATKDDLRRTIADIRDAWNNEALEETDLIIHVGIDGVLDGMPDHGLSAAEVASWGFKRVFAGDYHNHRVLEGGKVISIGATTHQQWGDIGTKAGFLLVWPDRFEWRASHAPSFIELTGDTDPDEIPLLVDGNYVRIRGMKLTTADERKWRDELEELGARGVVFQTTKEAVSARGSSVIGKAATLDQSVDSFVDQMTVDDPDDVPLIKAGAADVLASVRAVSAA